MGPRMSTKSEKFIPILEGGTLGYTKSGIAQKWNMQKKIVNYNIHPCLIVSPSKQSKITLTSLEVYTSNQYRIKLSGTGWKYKLPTSTGYFGK